MDAKTERLRAARLAREASAEKPAAPEKRRRARDACGQDLNRRLAPVQSGA